MRPATCEETMSGIETVKIIVDAEKHAGNILNEAQAKAMQIRNLDKVIEKEREESLSMAKKEASSIIQNAESEGKAEAAQYERQSDQAIRELIQKATSKKASTVNALYNIFMK
jgi:vacuolar-type H+-ATPase subunit H